jgi:polar amino acid transport system ATP-binding protein
MPLVALHKVCKSFGSHVVLDNVDLEIAQGEVTAIIGRSGSGKSTLLRCINGLESIDSGKIVVNSRQVTRKRSDLRALHREVGIVFQSFNLFPHLTVERNVELGPAKGKGVPIATAREIAREAIAMVHLSDKLNDYPTRLSGGQQQRVAIARALAMQPVLLLFDEITSALDPLLTGEVVRVLEELAAQGRTMILVTHEMGFARRTASKIVFMHNGRVWEHGRSEQLLENPRTPELKSFLSAILRTQ